MTKEPEHSRVIAAAAMTALGPLGLYRKGRSRTWLDDRAWWLGIVEFQPSSWGKGSYLNVGVTWLWDEFPHLAYHVGGRVDGFGHGFETYSDDQRFMDVAEELARKAAVEVSMLRQTFANPSRCANYYENLGEVTPNSCFHAAVACGLSGQSPAAEAWFQRYLAIDDKRHFVLEKKGRVRELLAMLVDEQAFRSKVRSSIIRTRELLGLPSLADWPF